MLRIGQGFDVHAFSPGRKLVLCGVDIPYEFGLDGHSDADVAVHAVMDAILGAMSAGDIGMMFPDTDTQYKGANSIELLKTLLQKIGKFNLHNLDLTIIAQAPKLTPWKTAMRQNLANALQCDLSQVSVKATTTEHLGFTGRKEGIAVSAIVLIDVL